MSLYTVNTLDQRVGKTTEAGSTRFVYAGQNQLLAERDTNGWTNYLWLGGELVGLVKPDKQLYFVHNDHLGRPELVTDGMPMAVWFAENAEYDRNTYGRNGLNIGFPGQYFDVETGLWQNGYRDGYDAKIGGYTQPDPIGLAGGSYSTYVYVRGNPISQTDPLGLQDRMAQNLRDRADGGSVDSHMWTSDVLASIFDPSNLDIAIQMSRSSANALSSQAACMATCAMENYIGLTPQAVAKNVSEQGAIFALKHAGEELGEAACKRVAGYAGLALTARDTAGAFTCATRCVVGP